MSRKYTVRVLRIPLIHKCMDVFRECGGAQASDNQKCG